MSDKVRANSNKTALKEMKEEYLRLLEESFQNTAEYKKGDVIEAPIVSINDKYMVVSLGGKFDAFAEKGEFADEKGELKYAVGDVLKGYIVDSNDQGFVIGKSLTKQYVDKDSLLDAFERKIPVTGKVYTLTKGGFHVDVLGARAFCPVSQIAIRSADKNEQYIGKTMDFLVIECSENCRRVVVSHRQLEEAADAEKKNAAKEKLHIGEEVTGTVMRMTSFGAFIDLGGIEGLMHVSEISWQHVAKPQDILKAGQEVQVRILNMDGERISLSMKALQENPFDNAISEIKEGDTINCRILRLHNFGAFAELKPGVEGLIPVSEMSRNRNVAHPREVLKEGDFVEVQVLRIDPQTQKISLSLRALQADPWDNIDSVVQVDIPFNGIVESSTNFGVFVSIGDGITGLLPRSRIRTKDNFKPGDEINLIVTAIDKDNHRLTLDYSDRQPGEVVEQRNRSDERREPRGDDSRPRGRGRSRSDEEWRKYANQKSTPSDDNPFKNL
jgi:small subunit ribosomal protein S1